MSFNRKVKRGLTAIVLAVSLIFGQTVHVFAEANDKVRDEVLMYLLQYYKDGVPLEILNLESIDEMIEIVDDKYTKYFSFDQYNEFINAIENKIFGIGVYIREHEDGLFVSDVIKSGPAETAGIKSGDIIIKAGEQELKGLAADEAASSVKGEKGTEVKLIVRRGEEEITFNVVRDEIRIPTVELELLNEDTTAHIIINTFGDKTTKEFYDIVKESQEKDVKNYIIDLRYNGGGYMEVALEIAGMIIGDETVLVVDKKQEKGVEIKDYASDIIIDKPIIFLVNNMSASSSEILSAAIRDYDKAYFIGDTTYGKGVAQSLIELSDGSALKVTTQEFFSPGKRKINEVGITPNLITKEVNPLVVANLIFSNINDEEESFAKVQEAEDFYVVDDSQYNDKVLNGWEVNVDMISSKLRIKPDQNVEIKFNSEIDGDISEIKEDIHIYNGYSGDEIETEVSINGKMLIVDPKEELLDGMNYIMSFEPGIKSVDGNELKRGKMAVINVRK